MIRSLRLSVVVEDSTSMEKPDLGAKHGLSLLVEAQSRDAELVLLMDTGPSPDIVLENMGRMGISPQKIGLIVISHAHHDHTGGLVGVLKERGGRTIVVAHPGVFDLKLSVKPSIRSVGSPYRSSEVEEAGGILACASNSVALTEGMWTSGEIERETVFEKVEGLWTIDGHRFVGDIMADDQALIVHLENKGLTVITGCAHAGIVNTIRHARKLTGIDKVYAVIGGFHLEKAGDDRIAATVKELAGFNPMIVGPCHCTGFDATRKLVDTLGDRCRPLRTGDILNL